MTSSFGGALDRFRFDGTSPSPTKPIPSPRRSPIKREAVNVEENDSGGDESGSEEEGVSIKRRRVIKLDDDDDPLLDILAFGLEVVWCGINPGLTSAREGHHYAHASNHFWKCLAHAGFTERLYLAEEGIKLLDVGCGLTNLVRRSTARASELTNEESIASVPSLLVKLAHYRPRVCSMNGMDITKFLLKFLVSRPALHPSIKSKSKAASGSASKSKLVVKVGFLNFKMSLPARQNGGEREFVLFHCLPSSSGLVRTYQLVDKKPLFLQLKQDIDMLVGRIEGEFSWPEEMIEYRIEDLVDGWVDDLEMAEVKVEGS